MPSSLDPAPAGSVPGVFPLAPQVLPTQLVPDDKGQYLRVRLIQKEGSKLFDPVYLFDEGSTISWIPCGRKLTCSFPGEAPAEKGSRAGRRAQGRSGHACSDPAYLSQNLTCTCGPMGEPLRMHLQHAAVHIAHVFAVHLLSPFPSPAPLPFRHQDVLRPGHLVRPGGERAGDGRPV